MTELKNLPPELRARLDELVTSLKTELKDNLVSLIVFGSAVRGGWIERKSDVDLVLVMRDPSREALLSIANMLSVARSALRFEAVILAADEIPRAADVFPLFYDDIRSCHEVLAGKDPFAELEISDQHRRIRIEQELREMQIRLRRAVVDSLGVPAQLAGQVERKVKQLRGPLHALFTLKKAPAKNDSLESLLEHAKTTYGVDTKPLFEVRQDANAALDTVSKLLGLAIDDVDRMAN
jgi:predicted nucleotidyltransferase